MSYRKKHVKNNIHKLRPKNFILKRRAFWFFALALTAVLFAFYFLIFSSKFEIKEIEISGNEKIQKEDLKNFISSRLSREIIAVGSFIIKSKSVFLIDYKKLNKEILDNFPALENVKIGRRSFLALAVEISERKPVGIFCNLLPGGEIIFDECFFIDQRGVIFERTTNAAGSMLIIKNMKDMKEVFVGEKIVAENIMRIILSIEKNLKNNLKISIEEAFISSPVRLDIKTAERWQIYFNLESDMDTQIAKMNLLLNGEIPPDARKNLKYIDLRFKDNAYYK
ncbi:MAG: hypothetical protein HYT36_03005 [Candidatus Staskawiczbacteria bacterium]|nr:hypothetical protein [Candidatus Staskawiczbacteria bacterium]